MAIFSKLVSGFFCKGGILATGIVCLYLTKYDYLPRFMNPVSYGMTSVGVIGLLYGLMAEGNVNSEEDNDPKYEERMKEFERIKPMLEAKISEHADMLRDYYRCRRRWRLIDRFERESIRLAEAIEIRRRKTEERRRFGLPVVSLTRKERSKTPQRVRRVTGSPRRKNKSFGALDIANLTRFYFVF